MADSVICMRKISLPFAPSASVASESGRWWSTTGAGEREAPGRVVVVVVVVVSGVVVEDGSACAPAEPTVVVNVTSEVSEAMTNRPRSDMRMAGEGTAPGGGAVSPGAWMRSVRRPTVARTHGVGCRHESTRNAR